jgi:hypothetical protein
LVLYYPHYVAVFVKFNRVYRFRRAEIIAPEFALFLVGFTALVLNGLREIADLDHPVVTHD